VQFYSKRLFDLHHTSLDLDTCMKLSTNTVAQIQKHGTKQSSCFSTRPVTGDYGKFLREITITW